jgi:TonB family protein
MPGLEWGGMDEERGGLSGSSSGDQGQGTNDDLHLLQNSFEEKPIWAGLYEGIRDAMFAPRLPPLELTSTPVPAADRMVDRTNPWAIGTATIANGGIVALLILWGLGTTLHHLPPTNTSDGVRLKDFTLFAPSLASGGGGSGGDHSIADPIVGRAPKQEITPILPPQPALLRSPILAVQPAIAVPPDVRLPDNPSLPNIGVQKSPNVTLASLGPGDGGGIGSKKGSGDGPGGGDGYGPGSRQGYGDSVYVPGRGGVTNPVPLVSPEAEFSDEARRQKYQGVCMISIIVDARGFPRNPRVTRSLGMGLDEKALEAVAKYRFKPAMKDGKAVASTITVEVNFRLY